VEDGGGGAGNDHTLGQWRGGGSGGEVITAIPPVQEGGGRDLELLAIIT
jgi:hypothetical protein